MKNKRVVRYIEFGNKYFMSLRGWVVGTYLTEPCMNIRAIIWCFAFQVSIKFNGFVYNLN